jgi:hypothetical protein
MMAESDVSRRNVVEGAAVIGGAVLASPAVAGAKEAQGFLNPNTYNKKNDFRAPVVGYLRCMFSMFLCLVVYSLHISKTVKFYIMWLKSPLWPRSFMWHTAPEDALQLGQHELQG